MTTATKIKNIILDLGGVVIDIDYENTVNKFKELGALDFCKLYSPKRQTHLFDNFETGKITAEQFRRHLKKTLNIDEISDANFDKAWNAMVGFIPSASLNKIRELKKRDYKVFLFSNTNEIHYKHFVEVVLKYHGETSFIKYFDREYYSHLFGQRKPNREAFLKILAENKLKANETLFIDDTKRHVLGAKKVGLHAYHLEVKNSDRLCDIEKFIDDANKKNAINDGRAYA